MIVGKNNVIQIKLMRLQEYHLTKKGLFLHLLYNLHENNKFLKSRQSKVF